MDYKFPAATKAKLERWFAIAAGVSGLVGIAWVIFDTKHFLLSYLTAFVFVVSIGTGAFGWLLIQYLVKSSWAQPFRRIMEHLASPLIVGFILSLPVLIGVAWMYSWYTASPEADKLYAHKEPFLNLPFFLVRNVIYLGVWTWFVWRFRKSSIDQDTAPDFLLTSRLRQLAPVALILLGLTMTFAAFDWIMSLEFHWYSNIFGVYFWAGGLLNSLAATTVVALLLRRFEGFDKVITVEHLHDLGRLMFGFTQFWAYIAFSQYLLIWYANIPEETMWFIHRIKGSWKFVSILLLVGHFIIPFGVLLTRRAQRSPQMLMISAIWLLVMHWIDLYWQVFPSAYPAGIDFRFSEVIALVFVLSLTGWIVLRSMSEHSLIAMGELRLSQHSQTSVAEGVSR
ncbi:MAG: hypothetical protein ACFCD0_29260 [Gemmataceae bacterium]